ncbi:unnamed protein product, partial [Prorocentrum cordatum]
VAAAGQVTPKYTHVQLLGFNLFTVPGTSADGCFGNDATMERSCYLGSEEAGEDVKRRADIMIEAINNAFDSEHLDRSPTTLKVFTAPEFYWRGPHGAYRLDDPGTVQVFDKIGQALQNDLALPPPGSRAFCKLHPDSNGCFYEIPPVELLEKFGQKNTEILEDGIFEVGGVRIGAEICLDHAKGELCDALGPDGTVDLQLVVSAGMSIAAGPVCTKAGSPVFLSDGFAHTELSLNGFGGGRNSMTVPGGSKCYNVGIIYGADAIVGLQQWIADAIDALTGTGFGTRFAGAGTLPGGSAAFGKTGIRFRQISALGPDWLQKLTGFYNTASYHLASK